MKIQTLLKVPPPRRVESKFMVILLIFNMFVHTTYSGVSNHKFHVVKKISQQADTYSASPVKKMSLIGAKLYMIIIAKLCVLSLGGCCISTLSLVVMLVQVSICTEECWSDCNRLLETSRACGWTIQIFD